MKYLISLLLLTCSLAMTVLPAQTYDLRFLPVQNDGVNGGTYSVLLQIKKGTGSDFMLGSSNFRFDYNGTGLTPKAAFIQIENNFDDGLNHPVLSVPVYNDMTSTGTSAVGFASINVDLNVTNFGFPLIDAVDWVSIATVAFTITDNSQSSALSFRTVSPGNNVAFAHDQTTILGQGTFQGLDEPLSGSSFPVELLAFEAESDKGYPRLTWVTAREENTDRFEVEEMRPGAAWTTIGQVSATGFSDSEQSYSWTGIRQITGEIHYRLKIIDRDGAIVYSEIRVLSMETRGNVDIYPIPASDVLHLSGLNQESAAGARASWYSLQGALIQSGILEVDGHGSADIEVPDHLSPGSYLVKISSATGILAFQRVVIR